MQVGYAVLEQRKPLEDPAEPIWTNSSAGKPESCHGYFLGLLCFALLWQS